MKSPLLLYVLNAPPISFFIQHLVRSTGHKRAGDRIPVGEKFSAPVQTGPEVHPASCTMSTGSFPGVKSGRGVTLTRHPLLVPSPRKNRAISLNPYGPYGLYRASVPVKGCTLPYLTGHDATHYAVPSKSLVISSVLGKKLGLQLELKHRTDGFKIAVHLNALISVRCTDVCTMWGIRCPYGAPRPALKG